MIWGRIGEQRLALFEANREVVVLLLAFALASGLSLLFHEQWCVLLTEAETASTGK